MEADAARFVRALVVDSFGKSCHTISVFDMRNGLSTTSLCVGMPERREDMEQQCRTLYCFKVQNRHPSGGKQSPKLVLGAL